MTQQSSKTEVEDYDIRCPYVIILGISTYDDEGTTNLLGVLHDVPNMKNLFQNEYKYKYITVQLEELPNKKKMTKENIDAFLKIHQKKINDLNSEQKKVDSLIFIYSGHGTLDENILCSDKSTYLMKEIHEIFDDKNCVGLNKMPKIFIYDCCRGKNFDLNVNKNKTSNNNVQRGDTNNLTEPKIDTKKLSSTMGAHQLCWYATTNEYVALEKTNDDDEIGGGYFLSEVFLYLLYILQHGYYDSLQGTIATVINKRVPEVCDYKQTPECVSRLPYMVYFMPSDDSKYKIDKNDKKNIKDETYKSMWDELLTAWGLGQYIDAFRKNGYDDINKWPKINREIAKGTLGMKGGHFVKFRYRRGLYFKN